MSEEDVLIALRTLAESDREREAPRAVEIRLKSAFQKKYVRRNWWPYVLTGLAAAAAAMVLFVNLQPKPQTMQIAVSTPAVVVVPVPRVAERPVVHHKPRPVEVATDFFPLMDSTLPFERGELLRVNLPASAMRTVGLPVREDRLTDLVQADVLVGEEGLARAIRFVRFVN